MSFGFGFGLRAGRIRGRGATGGTSLTAPTLTWTSAETADPPEFEIDLTNPQEGDIVRRYRDGVQFDEYTLTADDLASLTFPFGSGPWGNGTFDVYVTHVRGAAESAASNTEVVTIAVAAAGTAFSTTPVWGSAPTFTNANKTVAWTGVDGTYRAETAFSGKQVVAFTIDALGAANMGVGLTTAAAPTDPIGFASNSIAYIQDGSIYSGGGGAGTWVTYAPADTVAVLVNFAAKMLWATKDGTNFYGPSGAVTQADVEAGTGGHDITTMAAAGSLYAAVGKVFGSGASYGATIVSYPWTMPSGFADL